MAVMVTADVQGQTEEGYDRLFSMLSLGLKQAPGFVLHTAHAIEGGWRIIEVWQSNADSSNFFATHIAPNLPPGIKPKRTTQELHSLLTA